eukprot:TRINITY_DN5713_c0_g2_i2.p2 TRINITY_DN5713_c0_g2~~TRINITY_DN5713_c0_g2_i2.p2  ORF type:complete len:116 (+),score=1.65 TRINITY_DN5713_c0_g2_i2:186-533(+)
MRPYHKSDACEITEIKQEIYCIEIIYGRPQERYCLLETSRPIPSSFTPKEPLTSACLVHVSNAMRCFSDVRREGKRESQQVDGATSGRARACCGRTRACPSKGACGSGGKGAACG